MTWTTQTLWEDFSAQLESFILNRVSDPDDAEDILQEVFIKIHINLDGLRDEDRLAPWLYRITRNAVIDHYRARQPHLPLPDSLMVEPGPMEPDASQQIAQGLGAMIDSLPEKYRQALVLCELQGLTQRELAEQMGLSLSGAKSRVQRGRQLLRQALLACCHFEFDVRGRVIDFVPRCDSCQEGACQ